VSNRKPEELASSDPKLDGSRPDEEVGPHSGEAQPERCEFGPNAGDSVEDCEFLVADELAESFPIEPIRGFIAPDGLPTFEMSEPSATEAIPFTYETVVCVEDDREYVELFEDELSASAWAQDAIDAAAVVCQFDSDGNRETRRVFRPDEVEERWGHDFVEVAGDLVPVRMRRERCVHYKRQVFSNDEISDPNAFGHRIVFRNCQARRSNGGAYLSLRDEGIYSCDYRSPADAPSVTRQDDIDGAKLRDRPHQLRLPLFGMPGFDVHLEDNI
jgi:hypothetical protein